MSMLLSALPGPLSLLSQQLMKQSVLMWVVKMVMKSESKSIVTVYSIVNETSLVCVLF